MITHSGIHIQCIGGESGTPTASDIAIHAGRLCRFGGAVWYPLLPHLVTVGLLAYKRSGEWANLLWGFLHDAHECITGDTPKPFKCDCMRQEQAALDERILNRFMGIEAKPLIDFDLIHECDLDACDIEAIELGVPGYQEIVATHAAAYSQRKEIHSDPKDLALFRRILASHFNKNTIFADSIGVRAFQDVLTLAENHKCNAFLCAVESWGIL